MEPFSSRFTGCTSGVSSSGTRGTSPLTFCPLCSIFCLLGCEVSRPAGVAGENSSGLLQMKRDVDGSLRSEVILRVEQIEVEPVPEHVSGSN